MIELITLVLEYSCLGKDSETMCKAFRDKELAMIILGQFHNHMLAVVGDPLRMSTAISSTLPFTLRTNLLWVKGGRWKCKPRITP